MNKQVFMNKLKNMMSADPTEMFDRPNPLMQQELDEEFDDIELEEDPEEFVLNLKFIVEECPSTRIVREFMAHQISFIEEDDEFFI